MKAIRIFTRSIRDSFKSVFRNFSLSLASISCITITLIVVAIAIILSQNVNNFTELVERDVTIVAFLKRDITEEQTTLIDEQIKKLPYIDNIVYKSKMEVSNEMRESSDVFNNVMQDWDENTTPIQATYQVKVTDLKEIKYVADEITKMEGVDLVKYGEGMVNQLVSLFDVVRKISIGMVIALIIVTAFLISNTIKITIFSRKREIQIMRLVGASNINIKIPFILEGLFLGIIGSIVPIILCTFGYVKIYEKFDGQLFSPFIKLIAPVPFIYIISIILIMIGIAVGMFGSYRAVRKHLKI
ncbi:MAG: permease-like cell division protein FtsX [Bacilli bacterium]|nr:permease-like cell division protein FtsX [Bacilli bacterium]MBP3920389.1 permease-like cell division protein FtsX [Bacilli bacterium]